MSTGDLIQTISIVVAFATFIAAQIISQRRDRRLARREIYQRLELAAIDVFRFEADHLAYVQMFKEELVPLPKERAEHEVVVNYVCQMLNLFEMAIQFRRDEILSKEVFGSWVMWFYNTVSAPRFPPIWNEVRLDYTPSLRKIMDYGVDVMQEEEDEPRRIKRFFTYVGDYLDCDVIRSWRVEESPTEQQDAVRQHEHAPLKQQAFQIEWCTDPQEVDRLVDFLAANVSEAYISHGEIQQGRAESMTRWHAALKPILRTEFLEALSPENRQLRLAVARMEDGIAALLLVERCKGQGGLQYAVLHDLVVARTWRGFGIGGDMVAWLEAELAREGVEELYLESGARNEGAHRFFRAHGFEVCSTVMRKELPVAPPVRLSPQSSPT